jgi:hypothetical protein
VKDTVCTGICKSNYHTITTTTADRDGETLHIRSAIQKVGLLLKSIAMLFAKTDYKIKAFKRRRVLESIAMELAT